MPDLDSVASRLDRTATLLADTCTAACAPPPTARDPLALHCATQAAAGLAESVRHLGTAFAGLGLLHNPALSDYQRAATLQECIGHLHLADRWLDVARLRLLNQPSPSEDLGSRALAARMPGALSPPTARADGPVRPASALPEPRLPDGRSAPTDGYPGPRR